MTAPLSTSTGNVWAPRALSLLRIVAVLLYMSHGTIKLFAFPGSMMPNGGTLSVRSLPGIAGVIEVVGGALLLLGLFTRPVAFVLAGEMAVAYFKSHAPHGFWPVMNAGEPAVLYCFLWLYLSTAGGGSWSVDAIRGARRAGA